MKLIRKLIVGISTICLLVMTFVSATYAWFEINSRASVENFHFEVHGGQGFLVSIDNVNYYNDLTLLQLQKAMLVAYDSTHYRLADDGSETLYRVDVEPGFDAQGNPADIETVDPMDETRIATAVKKIKLYPTTTFNGRDLTDLYNSPVDVSLGRYLQFDVYFRTQSRRLEDKFAYEIYLNGDSAVTDDGSIAEPTMITSNETNKEVKVDMVATLPTANGKYVKQLLRKNTGEKDRISVYSSNAVRLSITDQEYYEEYQKDAGGNIVLDENGNKTIIESGYKLVDNNPTKIYELNDTEHPNTDLGSYATDYTGNYTDDQLNDMITTTGTLLEDEELALYCSKFNAMYTRYNKVKPDAQITHISYQGKPNTIRDLSTKDTITRVVAGEEARLLTFRLWLEGWDADCFDDIEYAVKARLAFGSKRVDL